MSTPTTTTTVIPARSGMAVHLHPNQILRVINTHGTQVVDTWAFMCDADADAAADDSPDDKQQQQQQQQQQHKRRINLNHHMSQSHTRASLCRTRPTTGDVLYTNRRRGILQLIEDSSGSRSSRSSTAAAAAAADGGGVHDTLIAACDIWRYRELTGRLDHNNDDGYYHESCAENLANALKKGADGVDVSELVGWGNGPDPLNLWMNIPIDSQHVSSQGGIHGGDEQGGQRAPSLSFQEPVSKAGDYVRLKNVSGGDVVVVMSACPQDLLDINCREPRSVEFVVEQDE